MEIKKLRGLSNTTGPERFGPAGLLDAAEHVDIDDTFKVLTREGKTLRTAGSYHSLWADGDAALVASGSDLYRLNADYSTTWLTRLAASRRLAYSRQQGTVYFSNGVDTGRVTSSGAQRWGVAGPVSQPAAAYAAGQLPAGRYQYAVTFRRADGFESGTGVAGLFELSGTGGIALSSIEVPSNTEVVDKCIYLSGPNGREMFRAATIAPATTTFTYSGTGNDLTVPLETQFDNQPPPGDIIESHNGVLYVVKDGIASHSRPYQFERFCPYDQWLQFPGNVALFAAVKDGIYVGTGEATWFLAGKGPGDFVSRQVLDYGAVPGTAVKTTMGIIQSVEETAEGAQSEVAVMWSTPRGVCLGGTGGQILNMTERTYLPAAASRGAAIVRQSSRGYQQYLASLESA